jgi:hypothetical protein
MAEKKKKKKPGKHHKGKAGSLVGPPGPGGKAPAKKKKAPIKTA